MKTIQNYCAKFFALSALMLTLFASTAAVAQTGFEPTVDDEQEAAPPAPINDYLPVLAALGLIGGYVVLAKRRPQAQ
ncbi:MAG: hypothetical protein EOP54_20915 [Sphingobacteriales bacterium]|nr:MAG: hypothetical protein EOP54_20915 [Sphingobacteriales bacterium]